MSASCEGWRPRVCSGELGKIDRARSVIHLPPSGTAARSCPPRPPPGFTGLAPGSACELVLSTVPSAPGLRAAGEIPDGRNSGLTHSPPLAPAGKPKLGNLASCPQAHTRPRHPHSLRAPAALLPAAARQMTARTPSLSPGREPPHQSVRKGKSSGIPRSWKISAPNRAHVAPPIKSLLRSRAPL